MSELISQTWFLILLAFVAGALIAWGLAALLVEHENSAFEGLSEDEIGGQA